MIDARKPDYGDTPVGPRRPQAGYRPADADAAPAVSIVTPFHNGSEVFRETAACVMSQSLQQWEWIIVNDGSRDARSLAMLDEYRVGDARVRVIDRANGGPGAARNTGYRAARAPYVFQLDADDLIEPTMVEKCLWFLDAHPHFAFANGYEVGFGAQGYLWPRGFSEIEVFLERCLVGGHSVMVRRSVHEAVGGYDESIRGGMEDWDFWLRCGARGFWGATIPEYLSWYRRRERHSEIWRDWDGGEREAAFRRGLRARYPRLYAGELPRPAAADPGPFPAPREGSPCENVLARGGRRLVLIVPWLTMGGADKFNLDVVRQLRARGWEVSILTTLSGDHSWKAEFARNTPDIFPLAGLLPAADRARFMRYFIRSRRPDVVMVTQSELGYLVLPYLRAHCPEPAYVDFCHMEEEHWKGGGYPRYAVGAQDLLDLNIVSSEHLKRWMSGRGADPERIEVCYTGRDSAVWAPDPSARGGVRARVGAGEGVGVLMYAGRICGQKQPQVFAAAIKRLAESGVEFRAVVAGDGPDRAYLEGYLREHRLGERVVMLGAVSNEEMRALMSGSDVFFLPSQWEGISLAIYEAMSMGLAVVAADVGGQSELVTHECGVLVRRGSAEEEAERYAGVLEGLLRDPARLRAMGSAARERIRGSFELDRMGDRLDALLGRAAEWRTRAPRLGVPAGFARECVARAAEYLRLHEFADYLWLERERLRSASSDGQGRVDRGAGSRAEQELELIENSRLWRLVGVVRRNAVSRLITDVRRGPRGASEPEGESPDVRLARIRASRGYRLIESIKRTPPYLWYARRKYGSGVVEQLLARRDGRG